MNFPIHMKDLGALVARLRSEGFDARTDLFNGQVGLVIGPNGLNPKRMPPDAVGLFFPLWELNYVPNRELVERHKFHEIFEARPQGWKFNRPYRPSTDQERLDLRHWNRSVSLLGNKELEQAIQEELVRRFPPSDVPVNIDVVGGQTQTYATVQISNFNAGIDLKTKAIPEDFMGSGGMRAAVLAATESVISQLREAGRLPATPQRPRTHLHTPLSLRATGHAGEGSDMRNWIDVFQYEVENLPSGERAWVANFGGPHQANWRILRAENGVQSDWTGDYESAEAALAAIQKEFE